MLKTNGRESKAGVKTVERTGSAAIPAYHRSPIHVVYGGADRFSAATPAKLGRIALDTLKTYAPSFADFAQAMQMPGWETLPHIPEVVAKLEKTIARNQAKAKAEDFDSWFAWTIYQKTISKLTAEPIEDLRIDFEDGYGSRSDDEEDRDAVRAATELAKAFTSGVVTPFCGFRIKSLNAECRRRAFRTMELFLSALIERTNGVLPANLAVTLPKIDSKKQIEEICARLKRFEKNHGLAIGSIWIELMVESPLALFDRKGCCPLRSFVDSSKGRCRSAHFGAYDYTSALGITASDQRLDHPACELARQVMLANLSPLGLRLSDSVTIELPVTIHKKGRLNKAQLAENRRSIHHGWRVHFQNVTRSMESGFFQSWDLHPNQLPARYAAVFAYFIRCREQMAERLKRLLATRTQAVVTGNTFDDAASAEGVLNFFRRGLDCSAFAEKEIRLLLGISANDLRGLSFREISISSV